MLRFALRYVTFRADTLNMNEVGSRTVGKKIADARKRKGLTQQQLADILETSKASVSNWERGKHSPDGAAPRLEDELGITLSEGEAERIAESYTIDAALDRLRDAEKNLDQLRAILRHIVAEGSD